MIMKNPLLEMGAKVLRFCFLAGFVCLASSSLRAAQVTVFAAASLSESLQEIAGIYEKQSGDKIVFNFAASGALARQVEAGAPADVIFFADEAKADALQQKGLIVKETRRDRLANTLVLVTAPENAAVRCPSDLTKSAVARLALGDPRIVPAGSYAKEYFIKAGLWPALEPKVIPCENVRAALAVVESGNVDAGMVYKTDAAISKKVKVVFEIPRADGPKITYPLALLKSARDPKAAGKFMDFICGEQAGRIFGGLGFIVLPAANP
jgi:molybdate transport system substrate-binding protein